MNRLEAMIDEIKWRVKHHYKLRLFLINGDVVDTTITTDVNDWCIHCVKNSQGLYIPFESIVYFQTKMVGNR